MKLMQTGTRSWRPGAGIAALMLVILLGRSSAQLPEERPDIGPTVLTYGAEVAGGYAGGLAGAAVGFLVGIALVHPTDMGSSIGVGVLGALPAAVVGCAAGTWGAGSAFGQGGRFGPTLGYTAGAAVVGAGLFGLGALANPVGPGRGVSRGLAAGLAIAGGAAIAVGPIVATSGYNQSRGSSLAARILPGSVALASVTDENGVPGLAVNVRALSVRF